MARVPIRGGFSPIPEGIYVFRIYEATYDETFGRIEIKLVNAQGKTHTERFQIKRENGEYNDQALNAFGYFAKTAMNNFELEDIDPVELVDHYIKAEVKHVQTESRTEPGTMRTFANLVGDKFPASGFEEEPTQRALTLGHEDGRPVSAAPAPKQTASDGLDLDALLG